MSDQDPFDLDEDIFCFEEILQEEAEPAAEEESLEAIFATFQADEDSSEDSFAGDSASDDDDDSLLFATSDEDMPDLAFADEEAPAQATIDATPAAAGKAKSAGVVPQMAPAAGMQLMGVGAFSKSALLILISVTLLNGMVGFVILRQSSNIMENVSKTGSSLLNTADEIKHNSLDNVRNRLQNGVPLPIWDVENHPTFELASQDIEDGNFKEARKKLSTFLALIDGIDPSVREDMEARAKLLIASSIQLEAIAVNMESNR